MLLLLKWGKGDQGTRGRVREEGGIVPDGSMRKYCRQQLAGHRPDWANKTSELIHIFVYSS